MTKLIILHRAYQYNWAKLMTHPLGPTTELTYPHAQAEVPRCRTLLSDTIINLVIPKKKKRKI